MSRIRVINLGPIEYFEQEVNDELIILIGEQASGKSTIAKILFYCKSVSEEFKRYLVDVSNFSNKSAKTLLFTGFKKKLRTKFVEYFGTTKHMDAFSVEYIFDNDESMGIHISGGYATIDFSANLQNGCISLLNEVAKYYLSQQIDNMDLWFNQRTNLTQLVDARVNNVFGQNYTSIFVPAGRSMLSTNSEFFHALTPNKYDVIMNDFIERIRILQKLYSQKMEDIVEDKKKMSSEDIDFDSVNTAIGLVKKILKGEYINEKNGEKIYYTEEKFVKLIQASSGQQESLWIVLLIFSIILNHQKVFLVIEEPEAHLFPNAQKEILELITLMINATGSNVVLTTHSPYILTATNLLMYSSYVEKGSNQKRDIVQKKCRLSSQNVSAYLLRNRCATDIMDRECYMIDASEIDKVSELLNKATNELFEREMENGL